MESLESSELLKFNPNALEGVRKVYNLHQPGAMADAINILEEWVKQQDHFVKKDFERGYLERLIIRTKGSIENAKQKLDSMCTARSLMPDFFYNGNVRDLHLDNVTDAILPTATTDNYRLYFVRITGQDFASEFPKNIYRRSIIKSFGYRIKALHMITESKFIDAALTVLQQVVSAKIMKRVYVHQTLEDLYKHVDRKLLPSDYGGDKKPLKEIYDYNIEVVSSKENHDYMKMMNAACTNEAYRRVDKFNDDCLGMPGTFRNLNVD